MKHLQKLGYAAIGAVLMLALFISTPALAESAVVRQLTAYFTSGGNPISIYVDGAKITPKDANGKIVEPFTVDGTTYLPVRALGEAIGKTVSWDGATASVYLGAKPGVAQYMTDICPAYETNDKWNYKEYSAINSGGSESFNISGVKYLNGFTLNANTWSVYNLNGQYTYFEATLGHVDGTNTGKAYNASPVIRIYCDGVLRQELPVSDDMYATKVTLNLVGVNQLKIIPANAERVDYTYFYGYYGFGDPILR